MEIGSEIIAGRELEKEVEAGKRIVVDFIGKSIEYEVVELEESVEIRGEVYQVVHEYYKDLLTGELYEPIDDIDKNLRNDYDKYREAHNLLSSQAIKGIRVVYGLSERELGNILGISQGIIKGLELGNLQELYVDSLYRLIKDPYNFRLLVETRKNLLDATVYDYIIQVLLELEG